MKKIIAGVILGTSLLGGIAHAQVANPTPSIDSLLQQLIALLLQQVQQLEAQLAILQTQNAISSNTISAPIQTQTNNTTPANVSSSSALTTPSTTIPAVVDNTPVQVACSVLGKVNFWIPKDGWPYIAGENNEGAVFRI